MVTAQMNYAGPSALAIDDERASLGLAGDLRRPVSFHAKVVKNAVPLRFALQTLGQIVWSDEMWVSENEWASQFFLDPIITVHPDRVFFEAFSNDQSTYGMVIADRDTFEADGDVSCGTTNVDFTRWLWQALGEMRSSRETWFHIGPQGFQVQTDWLGGRLEKKVEVPDTWVRGFLQLQSAMALPGTVIRARPVDVLAAIRFLRANKAKKAPRALRYEFEPGEPVRMMLEPWDEPIVLKDTEHNYSESHKIRTWGRRRLRLVEPLLPYANEVEIYLKGRALPSFYAVRFDGVTLLLGLSGWVGQQWTGTGSFDLLMGEPDVSDKEVARGMRHLQKKYALSLDELAKKMKLPRAKAASILTRATRQGRVIFDVQARKYRHRDLFAEPLDEAEYFPPDPRRETAKKWIEEGRVKVTSCKPVETKKKDGAGTVVYHEWRVRGRVLDQKKVEVKVKDTGQIIFGSCGCEFFAENLLNKGPCSHLIALNLASEPQRGDLE